MRAHFKDMEILQWQYRSYESKDLLAFKVHSRQTFQPNLSKIKLVDDLFSLSLIWIIELNTNVLQQPRLVYKSSVNYFFSTGGFIDPEFPTFILTHSWDVVTAEFKRRRTDTLFSNYDLHLQVEKVELVNLLIVTLQQAIVFV